MTRAEVLEAERATGYSASRLRWIAAIACREWSTLTARELVDLVGVYLAARAEIAREERRASLRPIRYQRDMAGRLRRIVRRS